jgi:predicted metal-binding membrane protein
VLDHWHDGWLGALRMGTIHGAWCVGCCWALMAALFALGVMSVGWMAFVAAMIALEKLLPWKALATRGIAAVLVTLGIAVALFPHNVPGLTLPTASTADHRPMQTQR